MKAIRVHEFGGPDVLQLDDLPVPEPGAGEVRVRVEAAGVNFIDTYHRQGWYPLPRPFAPGVEAAGVVDGLGASVEGLQIGDRVAYALVQGSYAAAAIVPAARLVPIPAGIESAQAAAMLQGMTAHYLATSTFPLQPGHTALIHAGAGGTGRLLVQMAKLHGARVIATVGTAEKAGLARSAGADDVIIYTETDFEPEVRRLTDGAGCDVVYDSVGLSTFNKSLSCLRPRGMLVLFGQASGQVPPFDPQILNSKGSLFLTRPTLGHYIATRQELLQRAGDVFGWMSAGKLDVRVDRTFPLADAADAHRYLEARLTRGKVLLLP